MKPRYYGILFLLLMPFQSHLFDPISIAGIKPDLALALVFIIGLLTGPLEAALAGVGIGLLQDVASVSLLGLSGLSRGVIGLVTGLLGTKVLNVSSPAVALVLAGFSLLEGLLFAFYWQLTSGDTPILQLLFTRFLPQAVYTGILGYVLLRFMGRRDVIPHLKRHDIQKDR